MDAVATGEDEVAAGEDAVDRAATELVLDRVALLDVVLAVDERGAVVGVVERENRREGLDVDRDCRESVLEARMG
jgi:hypothetical protein